MDLINVNRLIIVYNFKLIKMYTNLYVDNKVSIDYKIRINMVV